MIDQLKAVRKTKGIAHKGVITACSAADEFHGSGNDHSLIRRNRDGITIKTTANAGPATGRSICTIAEYGFTGNRIRIIANRPELTSGSLAPFIKGKCLPGRFRHRDRFALVNLNVPEINPSVLSTVKSEHHAVDLIGYLGFVNDGATEPVGVVLFHHIPADLIGAIAHILDGDRPLIDTRDHFSIARRLSYSCYLGAVRIVSTDPIAVVDSPDRSCSAVLTAPTVGHRSSPRYGRKEVTVRLVRILRGIGYGNPTGRIGVLIDQLKAVRKTKGIAHKGIITACSAADEFQFP